MAVALQEFSNLVPEVKGADMSIKFNPKIFKAVTDAGVKTLGDKLKSFPEPQPGNLGAFVRQNGKNRKVYMLCLPLSLRLTSFYADLIYNSCDGKGHEN